MTKKELHRESQKAWKEQYATNREKLESFLKLRDGESDFVR